MSIQIHAETGVLTLQTAHSTYQMQIAEFGHLLHLYYGPRIDNEELTYRVPRGGFSFCPTPAEVGNKRTFSLDFAPQEYSSAGVGDFRTPCLVLVHADGSRAADLRVESYRVAEGKPGLPGLPAVHCPEQQAQTLEILLREVASGIKVALRYSVLENQDVITRSCRVINQGNSPVRLETCLSACLDFPESDFDWITFYGRHAMERNVERAPLRHGVQTAGSIRGASSHQQNPFVILCDHNADETTGNCYGLCFVYSGNFSACAEVDQFGQTRVTMGIHPDGFTYLLNPGEDFQTPEAALAFSAGGLGGLSHLYHHLIRENVCRGEYQFKRRPVLINNWEGTYFDFDDDKLVEIASEASRFGVEMLVMDDGWFGRRNSDDCSLGDWVVNTQKLRGGLDGLCRRINALGMKLGIWFEPEMVSEDSDLYRAHPDWCLRIPGRPGALSRFQLVLDFSRPEVVEHVYGAMRSILSSANLEYVKWDMNRHLTDVWSAALPPERQGEVSHRYVLGVYRLLERLTGEFPHILFEGCSGGGGRFDAGMLYYTPQIWCSDNTDAVDRIQIQYGTSFCYPISAVGSHVSACPNHQTGRFIPLHTRGIVAMAGTFGLELDPSKLSAAEKEEITRQVADYKRYGDLIQAGEYYRLSSPKQNADYAAWQFVSPSRDRALLCFVCLRPRVNQLPLPLRLRGLDPAARYRVRVPGQAEEVHSGQALHHAGLMLPQLQGDYPAIAVELEKI